MNASSNPLNDSYILAIDSTQLFGETHPEITVEIPFSLAEELAEDSSRLISYLYYNLENLFPTEFQEMDNGLASWNDTMQSPFTIHEKTAIGEQSF